MKIYFILFRKIALTLTLIFVVLACEDEHLLTDPAKVITAEDLNTMTSISAGTLDCSDCDFVVPAGQRLIDGSILGLKPGSVIGLNANVRYGHLVFRNIIGTADNPIIIKNCGGTVIVDGTGRPNALATEASKHFRITGGDLDQSYGIKVIGGHMGVSLGSFSNMFEIDHLEIMDSEFAGITAKTDPTCDDATIRGNFLMQNVDIHHNYVHNTGGEGIYAGSSFFGGAKTPCGLRLPHEIHNIRIFSNVVKYTGWEGIQLGSATKGASIHGNTIENYGVANQKAQNNGMQVGSGAGGLCYNNLIKKGPGNGLVMMGLGDNIIFNNIIDQAGNFGIFCDERQSPGPGFQFLNNTIINSKSDGIRIYAELVPMNVIKNNVIVNPGSYSSYSYPRSPQDAFVYTLNDDVRIEMSNNFFNTDARSLKMVDLTRSNYRIQDDSPVIDKGSDISAYHKILTDFYGQSRPSGAKYDIGAIESGTGTAPPPVQDGENTAPVANAGPNQNLTLPTNSTLLGGSGKDHDGTIASYIWTQYGGPAAVISNSGSPTATVSNLKEGKYYFKLTVRDNDGASHSDNMLVNVAAGTGTATNIAPLANAGPNRSIVLPASSVKLYGSGKDSDGTIVSYRWIQYDGASATISNASSATASISGLRAGRYYFRLIVTDDDGATHSDNMLLKVE